MAFTRKGLDFLVENRLNNSKDWYLEHKDIYIDYVKKPFAELIAELQPTIHSIDNNLIADPKYISRIYRDTRFSKDKTIFRDNQWYSFRHPREDNNAYPEFYIEFSPDGFSWGCGYYQAPADSMLKFREIVLKRDKAFLTVKKDVENGKYIAEGDSYKRNKYPNEPEDITIWLNRKNIFFYQSSKDFDLFFSDDLGKIISKGLKDLTPTYELFMKVENLRKIEKI